MHGCPSLGQLQLLLVNEIPDQERANIDAHIQSCRDCEKTLERLVHVTDLDIRTAETLAKTDPPTDEDEVRFLQRLRGNPPSVDASPDDGQTNPHTTLPVDGPNFRGKRFQILRPLASGGLGVVSVAHDHELNREVALKEIKKKYADQQQCRERFLLEAEVTGRLEHPGVAPVYALHHDENGRPFYAMRLIRGPTLEREIEDYHKMAKSVSAASQRGLALRKLLGHFVDVCNTIEYAHSRGVLHRDLKPQNVIVGPYGETLVLDWGLAKTQAAETTATDQSTLKPVSSENRKNTLQGSLIGTVGYMSPEQAEGKLAEMNATSDVYSLGATLYHLLAGRCRQTGEDTAEILERVRHGDFPSVREVKADVPQPLEAVCQKALEVDSANRYPSARALADDVEQWLAGEPVSAWREPLPIRASRWLRRRKTIVSAVAAALLVSIVGATFAVASWNLRRGQTNQQVNDALAKAGELQAIATEADPADAGPWQAALRMAQQAAEIAANGPVDARLKSRAQGQVVELEQAVADHQLLQAFDQLRMRDDSMKLAADEYAAVFGTYGLHVDGTPVAAAAEKIAARPETIRAHLVAALDDWHQLAMDKPADRKWLAEVAERATDSSSMQSVIRLAIRQGNIDDLVKLASRPELAVEPAVTWMHLGAALFKLGETEAAVDLLFRAQQIHSTDFWVNHDVGRYLLHTDPPRAVDALRFFTVGDALRPNNVVLLANMANAYHDANRLADAIAVNRRVIQLDPNNFQANLQLASCLERDGQADEAIEQYREAIELNPNSSLVHNGLGVLFANQKRFEEAQAEFRKAVELDPEYVRARKQLATTLRLLGQIEESVEHLRKAVELSPTDAEVQAELGFSLIQSGDFAGALAAFQQAHALGSQSASWPYPSDQWVERAGRLAELEKRMAAIQSGTAKPANNLERLALATEVCLPKRLYAMAASLFKEAFEAEPKLADNLRASHRYNAACAAALAGSGSGQDAQELDDEARAGWRKQAVDWLRADLKQWENRSGSADSQARVQLQTQLRHWQTDQDLASLRGKEELANMSESERQACRSLWDDVAALLQQTNPSNEK